MGRETVLVPTRLSDLLGDVDIDTPADDEVLTFDDPTDKWVNLPGGAGGVTTLNGLTNLTLAGVADLNVLQYDLGSTQWVNRTLAAAGISAVGHVHSDATTSVHHFSKVFDHGQNSFHLNFPRPDAVTENLERQLTATLSLAKFMNRVSTGE